MRANPIYAAMGTTVFEHMSALCRDGNRINLGQGFPDAPPPRELLDAAAAALTNRSQQYPPMLGVPELRDAVAAWYGRTQGLALSRDNVVVTSGATEGIAAAVLALVSPGDEVLLFPPCYDAYAPMVRRAGGVPVFVPLAPPLWRYDRAAIEAAIGPRTRALILNDPLNPAGSVASPAELAMLAELCVAHDLVAICDEVWEAVRFDGRAHASLMAQPGMAGRTVKLGSAGKVFGITGWKIGWMVAAPELAQVAARAHQFLTFTTAPATQWAVAEGLAMGDVLARLHAGWARSRDTLRALLASAGFAVLDNAATWFVCVDLPGSGIALPDHAFAQGAVQDGGVATIPVSRFYEDAPPIETVLRVCHVKEEAVLAEGVARLARYRNSLH